MSARVEVVSTTIQILIDNSDTKRGSQELPGFDSPTCLTTEV